MGEAVPNSGNAHLRGWNNDYSSEARLPKSPSTTTCYLAEVVGNEALAGRMMPMGDLLKKMDLVAGRVAFHHVEGPVVTASYDRVDMLRPIIHMDLVRVQGRLVLVGKSSMTVEVQAFRQDMALRKFLLASRSFITMVAIDRVTRRPYKNVPKLMVETDDERRAEREAQVTKARTKEWVKMLEKIDQNPALKAESVEDRDINILGKTRFVEIPETEVSVRKQYLPRNANFSKNTVFGGDIVELMEKTATYTGRLFTGNMHMCAISMNRLSFSEPVNPMYILDMTACVVYVRRYILEVEIKVKVDRTVEGKGPVQSHTGYFTIINLDELGWKRPITTGLALRDDDQESLVAYEKAKQRYYFVRNNDTSKDRRHEGAQYDFWGA